MVAISSSCWIRSYKAAGPAKAPRATCLGGAGCDGAPMAVAIASALPRYFCQTIVGLPPTRWHSRAYQYGWPRMIFFRRLTAMVRSYHCREAEVKIWGWGGIYPRHVGLDRRIDRCQPENIVRSYYGRVRVGRVGRGQPYETPHNWRLGGLRTERRAEECLANSVNSG